MTVLRKIADWLKYERLHHYPALRAFDRVSALERLEAYEREERAACQPWLTAAWVLIGVLMLLWIALATVSPVARVLMLLGLQVPGWALRFAIHRRVRRRVRATVAAELGGGRLWECYECGYDLRSSPARCPECGASALVGPPAGPHNQPLQPTGDKGTL